MQQEKRLMRQRYQMKIQVTLQDILEGERDVTNNPISRAIQRAVGSRWCITNDTVIYEMAPPYRVAALDPEVCNNWRQYRSSGLMWPFEFDIYFEDEEAH
ncbi:MAG: hypothetical protein M3347_01290 [Armatimonadota bacterium]|nr:hypothetical protein [Armatimonadota bacterium]